MLLKDKNIIITGCARGIGNIILETFAANGANIWACARTKTDAFEARAYDLSGKYEVEIWPVYFDLADHDQLKNAAKSITSSKRTVDCTREQCRYHLQCSVSYDPHDKSSGSI